MVNLANEHISVNALCALWSETDQQLVATLMFAGDKIALNAIKAELEKNSRNSYLRISGDGYGNVYGARKGYINNWSNFDKVNAHGNLLALLHRHAHDPRNVPPVEKDGIKETPAYYVALQHGQDSRKALIERLQLAIPWAVKAEWADILMKLGRDNGLVEPLNVAVASELEILLKAQPEVSGQAYTKGFRVVNDADLWGGLISSALEQQLISL